MGNKRMASQYWFFLLLVYSNAFVDRGSAAILGHVDSEERESDGSYRPRDADHYSDSGHNVEFDHEAILGSVREAEEFDRLSPEEAKQRLTEMLPKMDVNGDKFIDREELKQWILNSFINLSKEEATERLEEADDNKDGIVTWVEYLKDTFGVESEDEISHEDLGDSGMLVIEEKAMWKTADANGDGDLDPEEFEVFSNPEEHAKMHPHLVNQTLREKDSNKDGKIDFQEYIGDRGISSQMHPNSVNKTLQEKDSIKDGKIDFQEYIGNTGQQNPREWLVAERDKFDNDLDADRNGHLDRDEIHKWIIPNNDEIADEEVDHLFASADDDHDGLLSFEEVVAHHDVFVGSEAGGDGNYLGEHFDDEL